MGAMDTNPKQDSSKYVTLVPKLGIIADASRCAFPWNHVREDGGARHLSDVALGVVTTLSVVNMPEINENTVETISRRVDLHEKLFRSDLMTKIRETGAETLRVPDKDTLMIFVGLRVNVPYMDDRQFEVVELSRFRMDQAQWLELNPNGVNYPYTPKAEDLYAALDPFTSEPAWVEKYPVKDSAFIAHMSAYNDHNDTTVEYRRVSLDGIVHVIVKVLIATSSQGVAYYEYREASAEEVRALEEYTKD